MQLETSNILTQVVQKYPYPIAIVCKIYIDKKFQEEYDRWEYLSRNILQSILKYLSYLLLSDLVLTGHKPAHLFYRIESILSRPMAGHYVGFLREISNYYLEHNIESSIPELINFLYESETKKSLLADDKPLLGTLVEYRNLWAHGRINDVESTMKIVEDVEYNTLYLLEKLSFLEQYKLTTEDEVSLMGSTLSANIPKNAQPLLNIKVAQTTLYPLILKLKGNDLVLLEDSDLKNKKLIYRGEYSFQILKKSDFKSKEFEKVFINLVNLIKQVRSISTILPYPTFDDMYERSILITNETLSLYSDMGKYRPELYILRPNWDDQNGIFERFLKSDKILLSISGEQGTGKSALVSNFANRKKEEGNLVLLFNAQRFTFMDVSWSGNPFPKYFANLLHYENPFDYKTFNKLVKSNKTDKKIILIIDAINEVDGIKNKWNRFKAMDLLLEWISKIAQPGIKIILSFRVDIYEDFEYLEDNELPKNLIHISYEGNYKDKPWITQLEPFTQAEAYAFYQILQKKPILGMAPAMQWQELIEKMGQNIEQFITNPLLFSVFLKLHHLETNILSTNKEKLFLMYMEKMTDADKRKNLSWFQALKYFIKDGNITPKERLIANIYTKMSQYGSSAFLISNLKDNKKRDRQLKKSIEIDRDDYQDLLDGGILVEENIEFQKNNQEVVEKRISFVGELLNKVLEPIQQKIHKRLQIFDAFIMFILTVGAFISLGAFLLLVEKVIINNEFLPLNMDKSHLALYFFYINKFYLYGLIPIMLMVLASTTVISLRPDRTSLRGSIHGFMESAIEKNLEGNVLKTLTFIIMILLPILFITLFIMIKYNLSIIFALINLLIVVMIFHPKVYVYILEIGITDKQNTRLIKNTFTKVLSYSKNEEVLNAKNRDKKYSHIVLFIVILMLIFYFFVNYNIQLDIFSLGDLYNSYLVYDFVLDNRYAMFYTAFYIGLAIVVANYILIDRVIPIVSRHISSYLVQNPKISPVKHGKFKIFIFILLVNMFALLNAYVYSVFVEDKSYRDTYQSKRSLETLVISNQNEWKNIEKSPSIKELTISANIDNIGDFRNKFPNLNEIKLYESIAKKIDEFKTIRNNLIVQILDKKPTLKWLTQRNNNIILQVQSLQNDTRNIELIKKLIYLKLSNVESLQIFKQMHSIEWICLIMSPEQLPSIKTLKSLIDAIKNDMPNLKSFEIMVANSKYSKAYKKNKIIYLFDKMIKESEFFDTVLFSPHHRKRRKKK